MSGLLELQRAFERALLNHEDEALAALVLDDGLSAAERIDVYRNNVLSSLTEVLADVFPAVRRLVDPRFFAYAAHTFITGEPPTRARLADYGEAFPSFLARLEPCRHLCYLPDVARLEWLVHSAAHAKEAAEAIIPAALGEYEPAEVSRLVLRFQSSFGYLESSWPVDKIWEANREDGAEKGEGRIVLDAGGVHLEIMRTAEGIVVRPLDAGTFAFRSALHRGSPLEAAADKALAVQPELDLGRSLVALFRDGAVTGTALAKTNEPETSP